MMPRNAALVFVVLVILILTASSATAQAATGATFRIIDVRVEYNHLVVEGQHFNEDGSHWFYENYTFAGREQHKHPRVVDGLGRLFLSTGEEAPLATDSTGYTDYYLPQGAEWLLHSRPYLEAGSILGVMAQTHTERSVSGWDKGEFRLTTHPLDYGDADITGAPYLKQRFQEIAGSAYTMDGSAALSPYEGELPPVDPYISPNWGTVSTFYPDASAIDGHVGRDGNDLWADMRASGSSETNDDSGTTILAYNVAANAPTDRYASLYRGIFLFDTSDLPDDDLIDSATFEFVVTQMYVNLNASSDSLSMVTSAPASDTSLTNADYNVLSTTKQAADLTVSTMTDDSSTYTVMTLNATGLGNISKTGITKFGTRGTVDLADSPTPANSPWSEATTRLRIASSREVLTGDKRPKLVVTHSAPPTAAITGTIGDGATEQEVRDGGTILITLASTTWVADGGTFDAQRQNIIDGLDSAQSEALGWNAEVRDKIGVASVVRTSDTLATVTIAADEVSDYRVDSNEIITVTVPASAIAASGAITATPTIYITAGNEAVTISGTLGASGGTPAEIVAGGETVIITLANTNWVADGSTFNAQRQNIIDGMDSNLADQNGWDARRSDFAVTDVARTSATVVTITLSASAAYAIPFTETVTVTVPASAIVYGVALVGSPTFDIVPTFTTSGNRVSAAIDLSSITDVAYCAFGWNEETPTSTTATVATSIDDGDNYSAATNGACPTGISTGDSLAAITDFRVKVSLTTTDTSVTPLVTGMALLLQDTSGPALYYQLNTTPGITITDRSANSNVGTMSFPINQTAVDATTGIMESTRSTLSLKRLLSVGAVSYTHLTLPTNREV